MLCEKCKYYFEIQFKYGGVEKRCIVPGAGFVNIFHDVEKCTRFEPKSPEDNSISQKIAESDKTEQKQTEISNDKKTDST